MEIPYEDFEKIVPELSSDTPNEWIPITQILWNTGENYPRINTKDSHSIIYLAQTDLSLCWAHMSDGMFSDIVADIS